jgi:aspartyl aminopeptidase
MPGSVGGSTKQAFLDELKLRYGLIEEDFVSAELAFVPAGPPREVGVDRALIGGYGQDDGLCSFVGTSAITELPGNPEHTTLVYLVDHEEVGNINNSGVRSRFLEGNLGRMLTREAKGKQTAPDALATLLDHTEALSADVSQGLNPLFPGTEDPLNTAKLGFGLTIKNMKPGYDGSPALRSRLRRILAQDKIPWQTYAYKVDGGGGGTIGADMQELNMDVVDVGVPLLAMHGTFELSSKADVFALKRFFSAFLRGS